MTAPSPLVEKAARAIASSVYRSEGLETMNYSGIEDYCEREWRHYVDEAQAALDACHADEMRKALDQIASWNEGEVVNGGFDEPCAARIARRCLATLNGLPEPQEPAEVEPTCDAEARFRQRFKDDNADALSKEEWGMWVDKLPRDEFFAMLELGLSDGNP